MFSVGAYRVVRGGGSITERWLNRMPYQFQPSYKPSINTKCFHLISWQVAMLEKNLN